MPDPETKFKSDLYDTLYETADSVLKRYDPCGFENGICRAKGDCCEGCRYLTGKGCTVKAISCKLWLCESARKEHPACASALDALNVVATRYGIAGFRMRKENIIH